MHVCKYYEQLLRRFFLRSLSLEFTFLPLSIRILFLFKDSGPRPVFQVWKPREYLAQDLGLGAPNHLVLFPSKPSKLREYIAHYEE